MVRRRVVRPRVLRKERVEEKVGGVGAEGGSGSVKVGSEVMATSIDRLSWCW